MKSRTQHKIIAAADSTHNTTHQGRHARGMDNFDPGTYSYNLRSLLPTWFQGNQESMQPRTPTNRAFRNLPAEF